jgi:hypothetical protein
MDPQQTISDQDPSEPPGERPDAPPDDPADTEHPTAQASPAEEPAARKPVPSLFALDGAEAAAVEAALARFEAAAESAHLLAEALLAAPKRALALALRGLLDEHGNIRALEIAPSTERPPHDSFEFACLGAAKGRRARTVIGHLHHRAALIALTATLDGPSGLPERVILRDWANSWIEHEIADADPTTVRATQQLRRTFEDAADAVLVALSDDLLEYDQTVELIRLTVNLARARIEDPAISIEDVLRRDAAGLASAQAALTSALPGLDWQALGDEH